MDFEAARQLATWMAQGEKGSNTNCYATARRRLSEWQLCAIELSEANDRKWPTCADSAGI